MPVRHARALTVAAVLALSFATYGLMKNRVRMPAVESLSVETALLFLRFRLLQGQLSHERYRDVTTALLDALAADGRVTEVFGQWSRDRLLGPAPPAGAAADDARGGDPA